MTDMADTTETLAQHERLALADDFISFGPDAPTILDDWDASDLLEHLIIREQRQDLLIGPKLPIGTIAERAEAALEQFRERTWASRVEQFRSGPQRFSPVRLLDAQMNGVEYLVHHEDLLRAHPGWEPRELDDATQQEIFSKLKLMARLLIRADVDVILVSPLGGVRVTAKDPLGSVRVSGDPLELLLWAWGRDRVAQVSVSGDTESVIALRGAKRGM
jgi:uncharacterized protein (TIGR03085 family)